MFPISEKNTPHEDHSATESGCEIHKSGVSHYYRIRSASRNFTSAECSETIPERFRRPENDSQDQQPVCEVPEQVYRRYYDYEDEIVSLHHRNGSEKSTDSG